MIHGNKSATQDAAKHLRWGVVGTGVIAQHFADDLQYVQGSSIGAVTSRKIENAKEFAARYGATAYPDVGSLVTDAAIDAVYVASPNETHFQAAWTAIAAGKPVLIEKPLAISNLEAQSLADFAASRNVFLMEGLWSRFLPAFNHVMEAVRSGAIGDIRAIEASLAFEHVYDPQSRFYDPAKGGGVLLDLGVYLLSMSLALLGKPEKVKGSWQAAPSGVDSSADMELDFATAKARLHCAFNRGAANYFKVEGSRKTLILTPPFIAARSVVEMSTPLARRMSAFVTPALAVRMANKLPMLGVKRHRHDFPGYGLHFEARAMAQALANGEQASQCSPLADSIEALRIIEMIRSQPPR